MYLKDKKYYWNKVKECATIVLSGSILTTIFILITLWIN